jgi:hypothetical protein
MVHRDDHRLAGASRELGLEPVEARVAELAVALTVDDGAKRQKVQRADPQRAPDGLHSRCPGSVAASGAEVQGADAR